MAKKLFNQYTLIGHNDNEVKQNELITIKESKTILLKPKLK